MQLLRDEIRSERIFWTLLLIIKKICNRDCHVKRRSPTETREWATLSHRPLSPCSGGGGVNRSPCDCFKNAASKDALIPKASQPDTLESLACAHDTRVTAGHVLNLPRFPISKTSITATLRSCRIPRVTVMFGTEVSEDASSAFGEIKRPELVGSSPGVTAKRSILDKKGRNGAGTGCRPMASNGH